MLPFDIDKFPSPVYKPNGYDKWVDFHMRVGSDFWFHSNICYTKVIGNSFCHPMIWFALLYGAAPFQNQADDCHLDANKKLGFYKISSKICTSSITHHNHHKFATNFVKICSTFKNEDGDTEQNTYYSKSINGNTTKHHNKVDKYENIFMIVSSFQEDTLKD